MDLPPPPTDPPARSLAPSPEDSPAGPARPRDGGAAGLLAHRPLARLALALGAGTWLGLGAREDVLSAGPAVLVCTLVGLALAWRGRLALGCVLAFALAFARATALAEAPYPPRARSALESLALRDAPLVGLWREHVGGRSGWVEPYLGEPRLPGHTLLLEPTLVVPREGTPVAIVPGSEVVAWPRGPEQGPGGRVRRFAATSPVATDELVRLGPAPEGAVERLARAIGLEPREELARLRAWLGERAAKVEGPHSAGLLRALAIGAREGLAAGRVDLFARTGTSHLLAISGWHVGLFAVLVLAPFSRWLAPLGGGATGLVVRLVALLSFAGVAGAEKPVLRATLAVALLQLAASARRARGVPLRPDALSFLSASLVLECLWDPCRIRSPSLALSHGATLGLIIGTVPLTRFLLGGSEDPWRTLARGPLPRVLHARLLAPLASGLAASLAAVLATLPFVASTFGELAPAGAFLTVGALPTFTLLSLLAWIAALFPAEFLRPPAELLARGLYAWLELGDALPDTPLLLPPRPFALLALATGLVFAGLNGRRRCLGLGALVFGGLLLPWSAAPAGLELHALDVGHGTAVVARAPGLEALVFDAGSRDRRGVDREALLPLLARWEVTSALVVLSHSDRDHASGLERLASRLPLLTWLGAGPAQQIVRPPHRGRLDLASGRLEWSSPSPELSLALLGAPPRPGNEGSRALELSWRGARILLLGDAEEHGLEALAVPPGRIRLLLAPHHGSDAAELPRLLERSPPDEVWISASARPAIGPELDRRGLPWRWTARDGPLALRLP